MIIELNVKRSCKSSDLNSIRPCVRTVNNIEYNPNREMSGLHRFRNFYCPYGATSVSLPQIFRRRKAVETFLLVLTDMMSRRARLAREINQDGIAASLRPIMCRRANAR